MKQCFKCGEIKELAAFYKHKGMSDGHLNKCSSCVKEYSRTHRLDNLDYYRKYDADRFKTDARMKDRHERYRNTEQGKAAIKRNVSLWQSKNPEKRAAHLLLHNALRRGKKEKPAHCSKCGQQTTSKRLHAHHHDYTMPLDVTWLCAMCHTSEHRETDR